MATESKVHVKKIGKATVLFKSPARITLLIAGIFFILALVENLTGATDITSPGTSGATLRFAIPLLMAGLGGLWAERAGVINIGLEGMMIVGTWTAAWFGYLHGPLVGFVAAAIFGLASGFFHAILTVKIGIDQAVSGLAINLIAAGGARYLSGVFFPPVGGDRTVSPPVDSFPTFTIPVIAPILESIDAQNIFFISNLAGILHGLTKEVSLVTIALLLLVPLTSWILWRSKFGLRMRFSGENPMAAESLGINVYRIRYIAISISGMLASLGGAYLALATVIFGNWKPGLISGSLALLAWWIHQRVDVIPQEFVTVFPNFATLIVLTFLAQRLTPPAMAGMPYRRGSE